MKIEPHSLPVGHGKHTAMLINVENCRIIFHFEALLLEPGTAPSLFMCSTRPKICYKPRAKVKALAVLKW